MNPHSARLLSAVISTAIIGTTIRSGAQVPGFTQPNLAGGAGAKIMPGSTVPCTVPFSLWNGMIIVSVVVGEGIPMPAVIDTGLPMSVVTPQHAAKKGLKPNGTREIEILDHKITIANSSAQTVRFERLAIAGVPFGICDLLNQLSGKQNTEGPAIWLGSSALEGLCVTIDPYRSEITIRPANSPLMGKATRVPFVLRDGRIWVDVTANDKQKFEAVVDTGAVATLVPPKVATALHLKSDSTLDMVDRNGKPAKVGVGKLDQLSLDKLAVKGVPVLFVTECDPKGVNQDIAVIGNDFLFRHRVTFDFGRKEIAFEPLAPDEVKQGGSKKDKPKKTEAKKEDKKDNRKDHSKDETKDGAAKDDASKSDPAPPPTDPVIPPDTLP